MAIMVIIGVMGTVVVDDENEENKLDDENGINHDDTENQKLNLIDVKKEFQKLIKKNNSFYDKFNETDKNNSLSNNFSDDNNNSNNNKQKNYEKSKPIIIINNK